MKVFDLGVRDTVLNQYVAELRDVNVQTDRMRFRRNVQRIGHVMAYEISKTLVYEPISVQTPLATATASIPVDDIVIGTVLRAGLPFHQGFLDIFDKAGNAFLSAYRYYTDRECRNIDVHIEYIASPNLDGCTFIIVDPMLATGESLELAYKAFLSKGKPRRIILASVIAANEGIEHLQKTFPTDEVELYCAAIDPELNEHRYIVPGLGDAGDLMYGEKM
ncbi:MAG: uracil phosphoribosyltransferase [Bacteroidaceae bacterium]|jgi:uracil phosphoribosyltransferase|nr:uracil phosphoribosyltransferase [Bacteroidaceae bacterium]MBR3633971.1 uracil phosphoribosyltransferase [Bacteroidaceae bacterium]MDO4951506.1 uracil phosphoribosyltransferase [Bacteroidales bacterium]